MPALFGGTACGTGVLETLEREFSAIWDDCAIVRSGDALVGGRAFGSVAPVFTLPDGTIVGLDGEVSFYSDFNPTGPSTDLPFTFDSDGASLLSPAVGNLAVVTRDSIGLVADWTGSFPLYYTDWEGGFLFSSHLRPLARTILAEPDTAGILEFLTGGYTIDARTQFRGIKRVLGGQAIRFSPDRGLTVREHSEAWRSSDGEPGNRGAVAQQAADALIGVFGTLPRGSTPAALMMSAGWDSRTLLAVARSGGTNEELRCYSHGDLASREIRLARKICHTQGVPWRAEPLDDRIYDTSLLATGFARTENVVFPHWHRAGRLLADEDAHFVMAGVFGEMLGGRYWIAHANTGIRKAMALFPELLRNGPTHTPPPAEARSRVLQMFRWKEAKTPWFLNPDVVPFTDRTLSDINGDVEASFDRYSDRGLETPNEFAEAYQGEHIGSRFCNVQLLSCRAHLDIAMPLANRNVFGMATRVPIHTRMQNQLNRLIIKRLDPTLLRFPMAATLVPASAPILSQEASRVLRKGVQGGGWALHFASRGRIPPTKLAWANYEFLRSGISLRRIVNQLRNEVWNIPALHAFVDTVVAGEWKEQMLPTSDTFAKILTLDMLLS